MYTNETTHFAIPLPLGSDLTTPMDYNEAAEAVDAALFEAQGDAATANENAAAAVETANATSEALGTLSTTVGGHTSQIAALAARMTGAENDITDVRSDLEDMVTAYNEPTATSTHAYSEGDYFIYNDVLYKATASIAIGATIVPNTNCEATNISVEIAGIKSDLIRLVHTEDDNVATSTKLAALKTHFDALSADEKHRAFIDRNGMIFQLANLSGVFTCVKELASKFEITTIDLTNATYLEYDGTHHDYSSGVGTTPYSLYIG